MTEGYGRDFRFPNWQIEFDEKLTTIKDTTNTASLTVNPDEFLRLRALIRDITNLVENTPDTRDLEIATGEFLIEYHSSEGEVFVTIASQMSKPGADQHTYSTPITCSPPQVRDVLTLMINISNWRVVNV